MSTTFANELALPSSRFSHPMQARFMPMRGTSFSNSMYASASSQYVPQQRTDPVALRVLAVIALALIVAGLIVGYALPGPITGLMLPAGLTLWFLVGYLARRADAK